MQNNVNTNIERIIAKIDNDFNPDNSDWIPRVGAWVIDAMSQIDVLRTKKVRKKLKVTDKIAYSRCPIEGSIKVFDNNGCEIKEANSIQGCCNPSSTGEIMSSRCNVTPNTVDAINTGFNNAPNQMAETINDGLGYNHKVYSEIRNIPDINYVIVGCNQIELNVDIPFIYIEYDEIETINSDTFHCELPVIPNNGILIEAITYYCMYKMLCRGYKHPVFNLKASQYGTNPYFEWKSLKDKARDSVINNGIDEDVTKIFRSALFINMFDSRR